MNPPTKVTGKTLEKLILFRAGKMPWLIRMNRYGVQGNMIGGNWTPVQSYPDFDATIATGRHLIIEAKVCSGASFGVAQKTFYKPLQHRHMIEHAALGALCWLLIHFNGRELKTRIEEAFTIGFPVHPEHEFWQRFDAQEEKAISRDCARTYGVEVPWNLYSPLAKNLTPDLSVLLSEKEEPEF